MAEEGTGLLPPISDRCASGLHGFCDGDIRTCGCTVCHNVCSQCGRECRTLYGNSLCVTCYTAHLKATPRPRCEYARGCTSTTAYRDLKSTEPDAFYCVKHHVELGHGLGKWER